MIEEGIARELVSRIQTLRKEGGLEITDRIALHIARNGDPQFETAVQKHAAHILAETLALTNEDQLLVDELPGPGDNTTEIELSESLRCLLSLVKTAP